MPNCFNDFLKPTRENPYWTLPPIAEVVNMLRLKAGNITELLRAVDNDPVNQQQILFLIQEELEKDENEAEKKRWRKYQLLHMRSQLTLGTETVMNLYSKGSLDKHQFVNGLGKNILPDLFDPTKASASAKDAEEAALEREINELVGD